MTEKSWWGSSVDPAKVSLTLKALGPFVLATLSFFNLDVAPGDWEQVVAGLTAVVSGIFLVWGIVRKYLPK